MRRTIRMVALSMLGGGDYARRHRDHADAGVERRTQAAILYTDPGTGQVYTKRCKHCIRLG